MSSDAGFTSVQPNIKKDEVKVLEEKPKDDLPIEAPKVSEDAKDQSVTSSN